MLPAMTEFYFFFFFLRAQSTTPLKFFMGVFGRWRDRARFLTFTVRVIDGVSFVNSLRTDGDFC
jgi:hypothetical protein